MLLLFDLHERANARNDNNIIVAETCLCGIKSQSLNESAFVLRNAKSATKQALCKCIPWWCHKIKRIKLGVFGL